MQPVTNLRIQQRVRALRGDGAAWSKELAEAGFEAYETIASKNAGVFSVGDQITMADVCLVPACWAAERVGVDVERYPTIKRVVERMEGEDAVKKAHWRRQQDTPEEFKA
jgi:Glutathione S-transferase